MTSVSRLGKIEKKAEALLQEIDRRKEILKAKQEIFRCLNQTMKEQYPKHRWCKLSLTERHRIYFEEPKGSFDYTNRLLPKFIPYNKIESDLLGEVIDLFGAVIKAEILRRRELTRGKIRNN